MKKTGLMFVLFSLLACDKVTLKSQKDLVNPLGKISIDANGVSEKKVFVSYSIDRDPESGEKIYLLKVSHTLKSAGIEEKESSPETICKLESEELPVVTRVQEFARERGGLTLAVREKDLKDFDGKKYFYQDIYLTTLNKSNITTSMTSDDLAKHQETIVKVRPIKSEVVHKLIPVCEFNISQ